MTWLSQILSNNVRGCGIRSLHKVAVPAKAGIQGRSFCRPPWAPACAGATESNSRSSLALDRHRDTLAAVVFAAALGDARRLAAAFAQVIELGAPHRAAAHHLDLGDTRRMQR